MLAAAGVNGPDGILKAMSIFLAGAGPDPTAFPDIFDRFALDVLAHAGQGKAARIAVAVHHDGPKLQDLVAAYAEPLKAGSIAGLRLSRWRNSLPVLLPWTAWTQSWWWFDASLVERVVAIDEHTALVLGAAGSQDYEVIGNGNCWDVRQTGQAAVVSVRTAR